MTTDIPYMLLDSGPQRYRSLEQRIYRQHLAAGKRAQRRLKRMLKALRQREEAAVAVALDPSCYRLRKEELADEGLLDVANLVVNTAVGEGWPLERIRQRPAEAVAAVRALWTRLEGRVP